jgi:hypothetical protein
MGDEAGRWLVRWLTANRNLKKHEEQVRSMYHLYLKKLRSFKRLQEASTN